MLSWNEIRTRAQQFAREWEGETRETGEYQSFWNDFFNVFGVKRRSVALYQKKVDLLATHHGFIDLFWPGTLLVEHKSAKKDLDAAFTQATDYFAGLKEEEKPRFVIVTDYQSVRLYDLEGEGGITQTDFPLRELPKRIRLFWFIQGTKPRAYKDEDPVNIKAVRAIARLYEALRTTSYPPDAIDKLLTRLVFCFFADDVGIFNKGVFATYLETVTKEDGSDIGAHLSTIFQILDTPEDKRQTTADEDLLGLPYVNGGLFAAPLPAVFGTTDIRKTILACTAFDWSAVSPVIFGSMFQSVMDDKERHDIGAHYTSEKNILKVIGGLFLDDLQAELKAAGTNNAKLNSLWNKISGITLLDPACGCGNFLVVAYRELRRLELEILKRLHRKAVEGGQSALPFDVARISKMSVERMYGIEILPFPAEIAQLSLWLADHLANIELGDYFGAPFAKLPLTEAPHITQGDALMLDWETVVSKEKLTYILGNPPFIGSKVMSNEQRAQITSLFHDAPGSGTLDFVSGWYAKAAAYIQGTEISCAFVSTNSITQGEQVAALWKPLIEQQGIIIRFAHRTFKWTNEAPGRAAVFCVIIGFGRSAPSSYRLYEYEDVRGEPHEAIVKHINPYLVDAPDAFVESRQKSICNAPQIGIGNKPIDGGFYLFTKEEQIDFIKNEPRAEKYFRRWIGADELLNGTKRWCLWLRNCPPNELRQMPTVLRRIEAVKQYRLLSKSLPTQKLAETPTRFHVENIPEHSVLVIPRHSSEKRKYIPFGYFQNDVLVGDACLCVSDATLYHFGVLESEMHMAWVRTVCGRLKSDYRYSKDIVYNNFPWPEDSSEKQKKAVEEAAQKVLDVRAQFTNATLSDLYNPETMPKALLDAHRALDRAVDTCYGKRSFASEPERLEFLFGEYRRLNDQKGTTKKISKKRKSAKEV